MRKDTLHLWTGVARYARSGFFDPTTLRASVQSDDRDQTEWIATFLHEYIHYWHATGTLYGNYVVLQRHVQSITVYECLKELVRKFGSEKEFNLWITLRDWRSDLMSGPKYSLINNYLAGIEALEQMASALEGISSSLIRQYPSSYAFSFEGTDPPKSTVCPQVEIQGAKFDLGGVAVEEGFAQFWQFYMEAQLQNQYPDSEFFDLCLSKINVPVYRATIELCRETLGHVGYDALPIISDLALLGPLPLESMLNDRRYTWEDIHPGWRFLRVLHLIKEKNLMNTLPVAFFDSEEGYDALTKEVCAVFSWPTPGELTNRVLNAPFAWLGDLDQTVPSIRAFVMQFHQAWTIRNKCPHAFALPIHCVHEFSNFSPPLVFGPTGLMKADEIFLSILVQEIIASGFLDWPLSDDGTPMAGKIECPANVLGSDFKCDGCVEYFPSDKRPNGDCWVDRGFADAFGVGLDRIRSVWR